MPWEVFGADVFHFNNMNYLYIVDYHSKFPVIKRIAGLATENLTATTKVIFAEYGILCKCQMLAPILFQTNSESPATASTSSRQCHQHITIKVMGRSKPALNLLNTHLENVLILVGTSKWCYYKSILPH